MWWASKNFLDIAVQVIKKHESENNGLLFTHSLMLLWRKILKITSQWYSLYILPSDLFNHFSPI